MAAEKLLYTAKFRRDYVAAGAVMIFFAMVVCEIALAIAIPSYLHREEAMARSVRRLELQQNFDALREKIHAMKVSNTTAHLELSLVSWNLNRLADYLRSEVKYISDDEVVELLEVVNNSQALATRIGRKPISVERRIKPEQYIDSLIPEEEKSK